MDPGHTFANLWPEDEAFAFDYDGGGKLDHLVLAPRTGINWALKRTNGNFSHVYGHGEPGRGIGGYDFRFLAGDAFVFNTCSDGKKSCLALFRQEPALLEEVLRLR